VYHTLSSHIDDSLKGMSNLDAYLDRDKITNFSKCDIVLR